MCGERGPRIRHLLVIALRYHRLYVGMSGTELAYKAEDPQLALAYNDRGSVYDSLGEYQRAIQDYDEAIRLDPKLPWPSIPE